MVILELLYKAVDVIFPGCGHDWRRRDASNFLVGELWTFAKSSLLCGHIHSVSFKYDGLCAIHTSSVCRIFMSLAHPHSNVYLILQLDIRFPASSSARRLTTYNDLFQSVFWKFKPMIDRVWRKASVQFLANPLRVRKYEFWPHDRLLRSFRWFPKFFLVNANLVA